MAQEEVQVQYNGQVYTLRVPQGTPDAEIQSYLQRNVGQQQPPQPTNLPGGAGTAYAASTANSLLFGVPEMVARGFGAGPYINQVREEFPIATTAGDVSGLISPATIGFKAGGALIRGIGRKMAPEVVESAGQKALTDAATKNADLYKTAAQRYDEAQAALKANRTPETIRAAEEAQKSINMIAKDLASIEKTAQKNAAGGIVRQGISGGTKVGTGIMGLQTGAGMLGEARTPGDFGPGFQQGSQTAGQMVQQYGLPFIPGMPQITQGVTSVVPGAVGYGSMLMNRPSAPAAPVAPTSFDMDRRIREEAYRRAIGQQ